MVFLLATAMILPLLALEGLTVMLLWGWYLVPLGQHPINLVGGMGISTLVSVLTFHAQKREGAEYLEALKSNLVNTLGCLVLGFLLHFFL